MECHLVLSLSIEHQDKLVNLNPLGCILSKIIILEWIAHNNHSG